MGSDAKNKMNNAFQPSEPAPCATGCGFFGTAATMNLCSKCYRDQRIKQEQSAAMERLVNKAIDISFLNSNTPVSSNSNSLSDPANSSESVEQAMAVEGEPVVGRVANRCLRCRKKVGAVGFKCRCGETFCGSHRYPEEHDCEFDYKRTGRDAIAKENPVVRAEKVNRI